MTAQTPRQIFLLIYLFPRTCKKKVQNEMQNVQKGLINRVLSTISSIWIVKQERGSILLKIFPLRLLFSIFWWNWTFYGILPLTWTLLIFNVSYATQPFPIRLIIELLISSAWQTAGSIWEEIYSRIVPEFLDLSMTNCALKWMSFFYPYLTKELKAWNGEIAI